MTTCQKDPTCGIFLKRGLFKNHIPICQTRKNTNTNTQIQQITKCQKDPTCSISLKRRLFKDVFWVSHSCTRSSFEQFLEEQKTLLLKLNLRILVLMSLMSSIREKFGARLPLKLSKSCLARERERLMIIMTIWTTRQIQKYNYTIKNHKHNIIGRQE